MIGPLKNIWKKVRQRRKTTAKNPIALSKSKSPQLTDRESHPPTRQKAPTAKDKANKEGRRAGKQPSKKSPPKSQEKKWRLEDFDVPAVDGKTRFHDLNLAKPLMHAIADLGFQYCTPIQAEILPSTLQGKDATGRAQTGTGKTAAFLITVITHMLKKPASAKRKSGLPRVLVLAPTRELVMQIGDEARDLAKYTHFKVVNVFGGMDYEKQRRTLSRGKTDIVVATPGRLLDFKRSKDIDLREVEVVIIDEADRMLDMGFIPDVRKIIYSTPHKSKRQTLLFSATLTPEVNRLAEQWTKSPVTVEIEPEQVAVDTVEQLVYIVTNEEKLTLLYNILTQKKLEQVLVFCNRKDETRRLAELLARYDINCAILSGDIRQQTRVRTLEKFKAGKLRVLVATDVAGRGIHIEGMNHVINYTLPRDPEDYVHRIGRTGRAGAVGTSISFADEDDSFNIPAIEELLGNPLPCTYPEEEWLTPLPPPPKPKARADGGSRPRSGKPRSGSRRRRPRKGPPRRSNRGRNPQQRSRQ
ncbi:MAG: DEAD/DEAH box helicase [Desulfobacteraceae bacterium]